MAPFTFFSRYEVQLPNNYFKHQHQLKKETTSLKNGYKVVVPASDNIRRRHGSPIAGPSHKRRVTAGRPAARNEEAYDSGKYFLTHGDQNIGFKFCSSSIDLYRTPLLHYVLLFSFYPPSLLFKGLCLSRSPEPRVLTRPGNMNHIKKQPDLSRETVPLKEN